MSTTSPIDCHSPSCRSPLEGSIADPFNIGDNARVVTLADRKGDGTMQIVAGADHGHVYGDIGIEPTGDSL